MTLNHVQPGQRLRIPAATHNAMIDAARAHRDAQDLAARPNLGGLGLPVLRVQNNTGAALPRYGIMGIGGAVLTPGTADAPGDYANKPVIAGRALTLPGDFGRWVMALQPIAAGALGRAIVSGVVAARITVTAASDTHADAFGGETLLRSGTFGRAHIIEKSAGLGVQWATLAIADYPTRPVRFDARITGSTPVVGSVNRWTYAFEEIEKTTAGYLGYSTRTGGLSGTAYNKAEHANTATLGHGVDVSSAFYTGTSMSPQPIPNGTPVTMSILRNSGDGTPEYEFDAPLGAHDGGCGT